MIGVQSIEKAFDCHYNFSWLNENNKNASHQTDYIVSPKCLFQEIVLFTHILILSLQIYSFHQLELGTLEDLKKVRSFRPATNKTVNT